MIPERLPALLLLCPLLACGVPMPLSAQGQEWQFSAQSAGPLELPDWLSRDSLRAALSFDEESPEVIGGFLADINQDGTQDYVFRFSIDTCGSNCQYSLVDGHTHQRLGTVGGSVLVVRLPVINGYPVIQSYGHSSADAGYWSTSVFDGRSYVSVSSIYLEGESLKWLFDTLREIPYWPPPSTPR